MQHHYLNGSSFGGMVGTARGLAAFLRDQLLERSVLLRPETKRLLETQQSDSTGQHIAMSLGWHIGKTCGNSYFYKEGGGGGFHGEMRLYPMARIATVVVGNSANFKSTRFLDSVDCNFSPR
jgi:hypothetical protein